MLTEVVHHLAIRVMLAHVFVFKINYHVVIRIRLTSHTRWETNLFKSWRKGFYHFSINKALLNQIIVFSIEVVLFGENHRKFVNIILSQFIIHVDFYRDLIFF